MTAPDSGVQVGLTLGAGRHRVLVQPGVTTRVTVLAQIDGLPRRVEVDVEVFGTVCPDPSAHAAECAETNPSDNGDCSGTVRAYVAAGDVGGVAPGELVQFCASHAQVHGRHIRRS